MPKPDRAEIRTRERLRVFCLYQFDVVLRIRPADTVVADPKSRYTEEAVNGLTWALRNRKGDDAYLFEVDDTNGGEDRATLRASIPLDRVLGSNYPDRQSAEEFIGWLGDQASQDISYRDPESGNDLGPRWAVVKESLKYLGTTAHTRDGGKTYPTEVRPLEEVERDVILAALKATDGDKIEAARLLRIGKSTLFRRIRDYEVRGDKDFEEFYSGRGKE